VLCGRGSIGVGFRSGRGAVGGRGLTCVGYWGLWPVVTVLPQSGPAFATADSSSRYATYDEAKERKIFLKDTSIVLNRNYNSTDDRK
jgi:hypothetical protein